MSLVINLKKQLITILILLFTSFSFSQIKQLNPSKYYEIGEIEKCEYDMESNTSNCYWLARLRYGILNDKRIYYLNYRTEYTKHDGTLSGETRLIERQIEFEASESELDFLYEKINTWSKARINTVPQDIYFNLGSHTLHVYGANFDSLSRKPRLLVFNFGESEIGHGYSWKNSIAFHSWELRKLFNKKPDPIRITD
ncbi:hypothetical protein [Winogradskyella poriferorum]|uniref:hypothetical protein n=1 Tax=Winogradskyella poriferorum TaxID=307627 RepID=UPI003D65800C